LPCLPSTAPLRASLALALIVCVGVTAFGQTIFQEEYGLRPTLVPTGKAKPARKTIESKGSPPGFGAGSSGFVSTNTTSKSAKARQKGEVVAVAAAAPRLRRPVRQQPQGEEITGAVRRLPPHRPAEEEDPHAPVGLRVGSFDVKPSAEISGGYDSNPFRAAGGPGSHFTVVAAKVETKSNWSRHELAGELRGAFTDYHQVSGNDRPEAEAKLRGRVDLTSAGRVELEGRAALMTEAAGSPDAVTAVKRPPNIYTFGGSVGYVHRFNRIEAGLRGSVERNVYESAELASGGVQDLSDRDYTAYALTLRGSYEMTPGIKPFLEASVDRRAYDRDVDFTGVGRSSNGWRARGGFEFARMGWLTGEASAGFAFRHYPDPTLEDVSGLIFDSSLAWKATALTTVTLRANSEIGETTLVGASAVFLRQASIAIDHAFRRWLIGSASITYGVEDYRGAGRRDERLGLLAALTYRLNRYAAIKGEARRERQNSSVPGQDFTANIVMLGLRLQR
jgi:hypothetical protein